MIIAGQLGGLGDASDARMVNLQNQVRDATRAFNGKAFTAREALPLLRRALTMAKANFKTAFHAVGAGGLPQQLYTDVRRDQQQLEYLVSHLTAKGANSYKYTVADKTWKDVRAAVLAPIVWQSGYVAVQKVYAAADAQLYKELLSGILQLPAQVVGKAVAYAVDQTKQIVEQAIAPLLPPGKLVPGWVFPTLVGGVALGLGMWVYGNFRRVSG